MAEFVSEQSRPYAGYKFTVVVPGFSDNEIGGFTEISGLSDESETISYREGNLEEAAEAQFIGKTIYSDVDFKRGMSQKSFFWDWRAAVKAGGFTDGSSLKKDVKITLHDTNGDPLVTWTIKNAWPKKVGPDALNAQSSDILIETMTLAIEGLKYEKHASTN